MELCTLMRLVLLWIVAFAFSSILAADDGCDIENDSLEKEPKTCVTHPTINEAQKVWAEAKQALIDQLAEQIKDDEAAVNDEAAAVTSVQRCVQTAGAAGLEARQQAKIINMLSKNSKELIEHIEHIEQVAQEELVSTEERVMKYKEKLQDLRLRIADAEKELVAIHDCGVVKPLKRLRRLEHLPLTSVEDRRLGQRFGTFATTKQRFMSRRSIVKTSSALKDTPLDKAKASPVTCKRDCQPTASEAQLVWVAAKQLLVNQLEEQIKGDEEAVADEAAAAEAVQRCIQTSVAAGLEAKQQAKIIKLLTKNSKELIEHIDTVEEVANAELVGTEARLASFKADLEKLRDRMTVAQKELLEIQECGQVKPLKALRRQGEAISKAPMTVEKEITAPNVADKGETPLGRDRRSTPLEVAGNSQRVPLATPLMMTPLSLQRRGGWKSAVYSQNEMSNEEQPQFQQKIDEIRP